MNFQAKMIPSHVPKYIFMKSLLKEMLLVVFLILSKQQSIYTVKILHFMMQMRYCSIKSFKVGTYLP